MKKIIRTSTVPISLDLLLKDQLHYLNKDFEVIGLSSPGIHLDHVQEREGVRIKGIKIERKISLIKDMISLFKLIKYFYQEKPDIVHSITPKAGLLSMVAANIVGCPVRMHTFTGLIFPTEKGFKKYMLILMDRLLCYCATNIYPEGEGVKKDLIKYKITSKPLKIIGNGNVNGVDLDYFNINNLTINNFIIEKLNISKTDIVFVFVGRIVKDKGIQELVNSFIKLSREFANCKLLLVGEIEVNNGLKKQTLDDILNNDSIISVGFQADVRPFLLRANVFVLPSYREGFPNSVLQAGAMGTPSVVTNVNGSNEIIKNGYNGLIIEKESESELYRAMKSILLEEFDLNIMGKNARNNIEMKFDRQIIWNELKNEYNKN